VTELSGTAPGSALAAGDGRFAGRTGLACAVAGCLVGAALALFAVAATWAHTTVRDAAAAGAGAVIAPLAVRLGGGDLAPAVSGLGLLGLAAAVALVATRGLGRRVVGAVAAAAGVGILVYAARTGLDPGPAVRASPHVTAAAPSGHAALGAIHVTAAPWFALTGGLALVAAGVLAARYGPGWPGMGGRYQARARRPLDAWEAIERGHDPTAADLDDIPAQPR
jgi:uncharacterized membrane protein (TIGR02234 family)